MSENVTLPFIDLCMLVGYLLGLIFIGKKASERVTDTQEFFLASRTMGRFPLAVSLAASDMGASVIVSAAGWAYMIGFSSAWWNWTATPALLLMSFFIGRFQEFGLTTVPELLERRYGLSVRIVAALLHGAALTMMAASQAVISSYTLSIITGIPREFTLAASMLIIVCYTMAGGFRAVVLTDLAQYSLLLIGLILTTFLLVSKAGGLSNMQAVLPASFWDPFANGFRQPLALLAYCFFVYGTGQFYMQRVFASQTPETARFAFRTTGVMYIFVGTCAALIGMAARVLVPGVATPDIVFPVIIRELLPVGVSGIVLLSIFACTMSSGDSMLSSASTIFTEDIYRRIIRRDADDRHYLFASRLITFGLGCFGMLFGLGFHSIIDVIILAGTMYSAATFFPLILGLIWTRGTKPGALAGILSGMCISFFFWWRTPSARSGLGGNSDYYLIAALISLSVYIAVSLFTKRPPQDRLNLMLLRRKKAASD